MTLRIKKIKQNRKAKFRPQTSVTGKYIDTIFVPYCSDTDTEQYLFHKNKYSSLTSRMHLLFKFNQEKKSICCCSHMEMIIRHLFFLVYIKLASQKTNLSFPHRHILEGRFSSFHCLFIDGICIFIFLFHKERSIILTKCKLSVFQQ